MVPPLIKFDSVFRNIYRSTGGDSTLYKLRYDLGCNKMVNQLTSIVGFPGDMSIFFIGNLSSNHIYSTIEWFTRLHSTTYDYS